MSKPPLTPQQAYEKLYREREDRVNAIKECLQDWMRAGFGPGVHEAKKLAAEEDQYSNLMMILADMYPEIVRE